MATKKPAPKKVAAKPTPKKEVKTVAKPVSKKPAPKPAAKPAAKPVAKKAIAKPATKPVAKKPTPKPAAKPVASKTTSKPASKPVTKKSVPSKPVAKPAAKKQVVKPAAKPVAKPAVKAEVKKPAAKPVAKPTAKKVEVKAEVKKPVSKKVEVKIDKPTAKKADQQKPVKEKPVVKPASKATKKTPTKTVITSTNLLPKKSDVYKTNTFASNTLKNDSGKVIAHRKTSELKRKTNDLSDIKKYEPEFTRSILDMSTTNDGPSFRYSDDDLAEFRDIIIKKLETAKAELQYLQGVIMRKDEGGTEDTENKYQNIEDGGASMEREQFNQLASRQITFIGHLEQALVRIENKTYGICRETGKLIDKARLRAVPHATLSIEAKNAKKA